MSRKVTVAAAHMAPVYMNAAATVEKACDTIREAGSKGVELLVFPESFVPGFPLWPALAAPIHNHDHFKVLAAQSVRVPGPEILKICLAAREASMIVSLGISESTARSVGCLWNSNLLIGGDGSILNHHRKLVPTFFEKMVWAPGDGDGLRVTETPLGRIGALICGENTNPLARYSLMAQGEQIHISSYPPTWPTHVPAANDRYDLASSIRIRAGAHSFEAKAFNIVASSVLDETARAYLAPLGDAALDIIERTPKGISTIIAPNGQAVAETAVQKDTLLIEAIDLEDCIVPKQFHDVVGYYNRFDVFDLTVDRRTLSPAAFMDETGSGESVRGLAFQDLERAVSGGDDAP